MPSNPQVTMPPPAISPGSGTVSVPPGETLNSLAHAVGVTFLFVSYSRLAEVFSIFAGTGVPLALVTSLLAIAATVLTGGFARLLRSRLTLLLGAYTAWLIFNIAVSSWRGGSFATFRQNWIPSMLVYIGLPCLAVNVSQIRRYLYAVVWATLTILVVSLKLGTTDIEGRFVLVQGTLGNANDYAIHLLLALPICIYVVGDRSSSMLQRVVSLLTGIWILISALQTGSRSGLLLIAVIGFLCWLTTTTANRVWLGGGLIIAALVGLAFLPAHLRARYGTIFSGTNTTNVMEADTIESAQSSTEARTRLFWYSLEIAVKNPIFGVGMGNFSGSQAKMAAETSESAMWREAHNIYTQLAAEIGIPGVLLYLLILGVIFRVYWRVRKKARDMQELPLQKLARYLTISFTGYAFVSAFATSTYGFYTPMFAAFALSLEFATRHLFEAPAPAAAAPVPVPPARLK
jgi:putative inorganic carbon (hco3(-)) transporter